jgi:multiple sugar transport system permease protein
MTVKWAGQIPKYILMSGVAVITFFPIIWIMANSLQTVTGVSSYPPELIPTHPQFSNYLQVLDYSNLLTYFKNTLLLIAGNTVGTLISSSLVAYPLARWDFSGKKWIFGLVLATMMVPSTATIIPLFIFFDKIGWLNTLYPLIVPAFFAYPYNVFLFRQFYLTLPKYLDEAAAIDGCGRWQLFTRIIVPLSRPIFITLGVLSAIFWWNELFTPLIYINSDSLKPLSVGALSLFTTTYTTEYNLEMAFSVFMIIPPMILYLFAQRYLVLGIKTTGAKG